MRSPGSQAESVRTCQCLRPRRAVWALALSRPSVLPSVTGTTSAPKMRVLSRLNGWPMRSPVNASPIPSRVYVHVCKMETLRAAYEMAKRNDGAPGIDGVTFEAIEESGAESFLRQIREELVTNRYR